jgi:8-oxo-dGTP pyrophosphatase MutT (NUDIX family)
MRNRYPVAVHLFFLRDGQVLLLLRRFNTGWQDGNYSLPAGHVEAGETVTAAAIREAFEETGVLVQPADLEVVHVMHRKSEEERIDFFLKVHDWSGTIVNNEPQKCDDLAWYPLTGLPKNIISYIRRGLMSYHNNIHFSEFGWGKNEDES